MDAGIPGIMPFSPVIITVIPITLRINQTIHPPDVLKCIFLWKRSLQ